ncbi:Fur family transcriptional regulator [Hahella sp. CCB-MM4]|uniref:Fur family transcriptional regulator n=1 Tax=Hahella sp. (strain CCB-MM4) TaxID=1926491 RepID=UPI000B9A3B06|nr:Fur family transcriptional regulator [Hahella sp. CCB-MM4]OZG75512.1 Fur family transcriptional regulator [Hahella sp. CCB-MM4]
MTETTVFSQHDHKRCIQDALETAKELCRNQGLRLTDTRLRVLELIWQSHTPVGAYEILAKFNEEGRNSAPPTVYRALEFLQEHNLVHRLASLNAFIGCIAPEHGHQGSFLICRKCSKAQELTSAELEESIQALAGKQGFTVDNMTLEVSGLCPRCKAEA